MLIKLIRRFYLFFRLYTKAKCIATISLKFNLFEYQFRTPERENVYSFILSVTYLPGFTISNLFTLLQFYILISMHSPMQWTNSLTILYALSNTWIFIKEKILGGFTAKIEIRTNIYRTILGKLKKKHYKLYYSLPRSNKQKLTVMISRITNKTPD